MNESLADLEFLESLRQDFFDETMENLEKCEECLLKFENNKEDSLLREYLRLLHSIKGSARAVEFDKVATAIHQIESLGHKNEHAQFIEVSLSLVDDLRTVMQLIKSKDMLAMDKMLDLAIQKATL